MRWYSFRMLVAVVLCLLASPQWVRAEVTDKHPTTSPVNDVVDVNTHSSNEGTHKSTHSDIDAVDVNTQPSSGDALKSTHADIDTVDVRTQSDKRTNAHTRLDKGQPSEIAQEEPRTHVDGIADSHTHGPNKVQKAEEEVQGGTHRDTRDNGPDTDELDIESSERVHTDTQQRTHPDTSDHAHAHAQAHADAPQNQKNGPSVHRYTRKERIALSEEVKGMFAHAFNGYIQHAYPADELKPVTCNARWRRDDEFRGDIDRCMGNFSLTLIDSLDTIAVMGDTELFFTAVNTVVTTVHFNTSVVVSVFEVTIRVLGGLLSAHALALHLLEDKHAKDVHGDAFVYTGGLLDLAVDLGDRLLKAFDTQSGLPLVRVDLVHGVPEGDDLNTCTACAGTVLLEFVTLSRFSGNPIYESKARIAMVALYEGRYLSNLVSRTYSTVTGQSSGAHAGVGASIDSYYEYLMKAYIVTGDKGYLHMFYVHYDSIIRFGTRGYFFVDADAENPVYMKTPHLDALQAFFPGLQVLVGDVHNAKVAYRALHTVAQKNRNLIPEVFARDGSQTDPHYLLRPEFIESTYMLYSATKKDKYLQYGVDFMSTLNTLTRTECGFAALKNITSGEKLDRMDSFFLAETLKYLYLLFRPKDLVSVDLDKFEFTTEAHLVPISIKAKPTARPNTHEPLSELIPLSEILIGYEEVTYLYCPNENDWMGIYSASALLSDVCTAEDDLAIVSHEERAQFVDNFSPKTIDLSDTTTFRVLESAGIWVMRNKEKVELVYSPAMAVRLSDKVLGLRILHALKKDRAAEDSDAKDMPTMNDRLLRYIRVVPESHSAEDYEDTSDNSQTSHTTSEYLYLGLQGDFGDDVAAMGSLKGPLTTANPEPHDACGTVTVCDGCVLLVLRGSCTFTHKALNAQTAGAAAMIVADTSTGDHGLIQMANDATDGAVKVSIPSLFVTRQTADQLRAHLQNIAQPVEVEITVADVD